MILEEKVSELESMVQKLAYIQMNTQMSIEKLTVEMRDFKTHTQRAIDRMEKDTKEMKRDMSRQWAKTVKKLGTLVEDIVAPSIKFIAEKYFGCNNLIDFGVRRWKVKPEKPSQGREFDVIAVYESKIIVNETKSNPCDISEVDKFINLIKNEIFEYFPEYKDKKVIPVFSSLYVPEHIKRYLIKNKVYAIGMKEDTMDLLTPELLNE